MSAAVRLALAVALVWLRPMRSARKIRSQHEAIMWLVDRIVASQDVPAPRPRHLYLVKGGRS